MVRPASGFSLIEVLVAFSITAVSLGLIFQIYAKGNRAVVLAEEYAQALAIAESKLAGASVPDALAGLDTQGRENDRYNWEIRIEDYILEEQNPDLRLAYALHSVDVAVSWQSRGKSHRVDLQTLKPAFPGREATQ